MLNKLCNGNKRVVTALIVDYYAYIEYRDSYKVFAQSGEKLWTYSPEELTEHITTKLI